MTTEEAVGRVERALFERPDQYHKNWIRCGDSDEDRFYMEAALEPDLAEALAVVLKAARGVAGPPSVAALCRMMEESERRIQEMSKPCGPLGRLFGVQTSTG